MDIEVRNPATGALTGKVTTSTDGEIVRLGAAARNAQKRWSALPIRDRARVLVRSHDQVLKPPASWGPHCASGDGSRNPLNGAGSKVSIFTKVVWVTKVLLVHESLFE
jgi:hypothetical protein